MPLNSLKYSHFAAKIAGPATFYLAAKSITKVIKGFVIIIAVITIKDFGLEIMSFSPTVVIAITTKDASFIIVN
jgi:hypothetical protein